MSEFWRPRALVLGLGNPLMGDDGAGIAALERLQESWVLPASVAAVDGGTWGMNLLHLIEEADQVLLLDAIHAGQPPGSLVTMERDQLPRLFAIKLSPHQIDLREVLAVADLRDTLPAELAAAAAARLAAWGHAVRPAVKEPSSIVPGPFIASSRP